MGSTRTESLDDGRLVLLLLQNHDGIGRNLLYNLWGKYDKSGFLDIYVSGYGEGTIFGRSHQLASDVPTSIPPAMDKNFLSIRGAGDEEKKSSFGLH